jgi:hypothetical protein
VFNAWSATLRVHSLLVIIFPVLFLMIGKRNGK